MKTQILQTLFTMLIVPALLFLQTPNAFGSTEGYQKASKYMVASNRGKYPKRDRDSDVVNSKGKKKKDQKRKVASVKAKKKKKDQKRKVASSKKSKAKKKKKKKKTKSY